MKLKTLIAAAALSLVSLASHADVIYEWQPTNNLRPWDFKMRLVFSDEAFHNGSFALRQEPQESRFPTPDSGLISMTYGFDYLSTYEPRTQAVGLRRLDMNLTFGQWQIDSGYIKMNDQFISFDLSGSGIFTITNAAGDGGLWNSGCAQQAEQGRVAYKDCNGAQGQFIQVPEPTSFALLGLGMAGALAARRRKHKQ